MQSLDLKLVQRLDMLILQDWSGLDQICLDDLGGGLEILE